MHFLGSFFFEEGISQHEKKDFIGGRARIEGAAMIYFSMFGDDIAERSSKGMSTDSFLVVLMRLSDLIKKL